MSERRSRLAVLKEEMAEKGIFPGWGTGRPRCSGDHCARWSSAVGGWCHEDHGPQRAADDCGPASEAMTCTLESIDAE